MTTKATKDYSQGKIYKIEPTVEHDEGDIYIGSTTNKYLSQRMTNHRKQYMQWKKGNRNMTTSFILFDKYGIQSCIIVLIENVNALNYDELVSREAHYIKALQCVNKYIPLRNRNEYYHDNKEWILEDSKVYYEKNKEYYEQYRLDHKDQKKEYNKLYNDEKKEEISQQKKLYYEANKEIIKERKRNAYQKKKQEKESLGNV